MLQRVRLSRKAKDLVRWLEENGPCEMTKEIFEDSQEAQEVVQAQLAVHEDGQLKLIKDSKISR